MLLEALEERFGNFNLHECIMALEQSPVNMYVYIYVFNQSDALNPRTRTERIVISHWLLGAAKV